MQLEVGKYYKTRDGRKVGPLKDWPDRIWKFKCGESYYKSDGHHEYDDYGSHVHECDLIAEWTDEPVSILSAETIDMIAIDSLKHHADKDMEPLQREAFRIVLRYYGVTL